MKQSAKKKRKKVAEDGEFSPPVKRTADELDTAYFIAEATLNEQQTPTSPAPAAELPAPAPVPPPLAPLEAIWPNEASPPGPSKSSQAEDQQLPKAPVNTAAPEVAPAPATSLPEPLTEPEPPNSPSKAAVTTGAPNRPAAAKVKVTFVLPICDAKRVSLSGDFNGWSRDATPMELHADGHWEATVDLAPGRYEYKFVRDGEWIPDLLAQENVLNQHGTLNSVIKVRAG